MKTKILSRALQAFALYLFLSASYTILGKIITIRTSEKTDGKVVSSYKELDYSTQTSGKRYGTSHYIERPIIRYEINGEIHEINGRIFGEVGNDYQIGQSVPLYYSVDQPSYAIINSFQELWFPSIKTIFWAIFVFFVGTFLAQILIYTKNRLYSFFNTFRI